MGQGALSSLLISPGSAARRPSVFHRMTQGGAPSALAEPLLSPRVSTIAWLYGRLYVAHDNCACARRGMPDQCGTGICATLGTWSNAALRRLLLRGHQLRRPLFLLGGRRIDITSLIGQQRRDFIDPHFR